MVLPARRSRAEDVVGYVEEAIEVREQLEPLVAVHAAQRGTYVGL